MSPPSPALTFARPRTTPSTAAALIVAWSAALWLALSAPRWLSADVPALDVPLALNHHGLDAGDRTWLPRGTTLTNAAELEPVRLAHRRRHTPDHRVRRGLLALLLGTVTGLAWCGHLHQVGGRLRRRRDLLALTVWLVAAVFAHTTFAWFAPFSLAWLPALAFVVPVTRQSGRRVAMAFTLALAFVSATLTEQFDMRVLVATTAAGAAAAAWLTAPRAPKRGRVVVAGTIAGFASMLAVAAASLAAGRGIAFDPDWAIGTLVGSVFWSAVGVAVEPGLARLLGNLSRSALLALADLGHPLLQRIAERAPGTWAHSRMMANLAESAAQRIGADALLVRVGAYYHDLGKADAPQFFVENNLRGQPNVHDELDPQQSARHIIEHVTASVRRGRAAGLPEDIIAFMHTHHGSGRPEYFYQKARQAADDPEQVDPAEFTYPGERPQDRENGIMAIVDAVEAAARTLREPTREAMEDLVHRLIMGKLRAGQLDDSGLGPGDLRTIAEDLVHSLMAAAHDRIAYPWQKRHTGMWNAADQAPAEEPTSHHYARVTAPPGDATAQPDTSGSAGTPAIPDRSSPSDPSPPNSSAFAERDEMIAANYPVEVDRK